MNRLNGLLTAMLALMLIGGSAYAGADGSAQAENPTDPMTSSSAYTEDELVDLVVIDQEGSKIGTIKSVSKNDETGEINFVTLAEGGFLGMGRNEHAVPLEALNIRSEEGEATLLVSRDKLLSSPAPEVGLTDEEFRGVINQHYGIGPAWEENKGESEMMEGEKEYQERNDY